LFGYKKNKGMAYPILYPVTVTDSPRIKCKVSVIINGTGITKFDVEALLF
jgi:hypothetical protein